MSNAPDGASNLGTLIRSMRPRILDGEYVFCTFGPSNDRWRSVEFMGAFREGEGMTLIVARDVAEREGLSYSGVWSCITCTVHSNLQAVGFLAAISVALARAGISVNVVSAFYHDHCFVRTEDAVRGLEVLETLSREWAEADSDVREANVDGEELP